MVYVSVDQPHVPRDTIFGTGDVFRLLFSAKEALDTTKKPGFVKLMPMLLNALMVQNSRTVVVPVLHQEITVPAPRGAVPRLPLLAQEVV
jgi:hypothetical protein